MASDLMGLVRLGVNSKVGGALINQAQAFAAQQSQQVARQATLLATQDDVQNVGNEAIRQGFNANIALADLTDNGTLSLADTADEVWSFEVDPTVVGGAGTALTEAGRLANMLRLELVLWRSISAPHFLFTQPFVESGGDVLQATPLFAVVPSDKLGSETTQEFLSRVVPSWTWETTFPDVELVTGFETSGASGFTFNVLYSPLTSAPSLAQIKALWDYTPSSGPPERNGIDDSMSIYSLLPVQF